MSDVKYCPYCGTSLTGAATFCHNCGKNQNVETNSVDINAEISSVQDIKQDNADGNKSSEEITTEAADIPQRAQAAQPAALKENGQQKPEIKEKTKKKFPWFFAVIWGLLLIGVAAWGLYLYYLYVGGFDYPEFTEDAQRIVLFVSAVFVLIYTLSLKLSMKKSSVFPAILLVLACLVIFYFYCMVELQDGDFLHDLVSGITDRILPATGLE